MAYPQPGQYPAYPQYPGPSGMPAKPPAPQTVQYAFYLMLAGAALQLLSGIAALGSVSKIRDTLRDQHPDYTSTQIDSAVRIGEAFAIILVLIGMGLWIWMAFANRAGKNWARITGTVFFGLDSLSLVISLAASGSNAMSTTKASPFGVVVNILVWLAGLAAVILLWNKQSSAYFSPPQQFGPGGPGGYGYPPYPPYQAPGQQPYGGMPPQYGAPPQQQYGAPQQQPYGTPQQPSDPWSNPNPPQQQ
jgi:hypothetical protein